MDDPKGLPYYMQAVESRYAGTSQSIVMLAIEEEDTPEQAARGKSDTEEQDGGEVLDEEAVVESTVEEL